MLIKASISFAVISCFVMGENCPSGGQIYSRGLTESMELEIEELHNRYRLQIAQGLVEGQPAGVNLRKMVYDRELGKSARIVSDTCKIEHILGKDRRWPHVGQNLYMVWSSVNISTPIWRNAMMAWFVEHKDFIYPNISLAKTGHYTQLVWATTTHVGCDFIHFYDNDPKRVANPYARLYSCNYGPGGNTLGQAPYKTGSVNNCPHLC